MCFIVLQGGTEALAPAPEEVCASVEHMREGTESLSSVFWHFLKIVPRSRPGGLPRGWPRVAGSTSALKHERRMMMKRGYGAADTELPSRPVILDASSRSQVGAIKPSCLQLVRKLTCVQLSFWRH